MDDGSNNNPLLSKYLDPQCSALSMLANVATERDSQETSSFVPCIKFCLTPMKPMNNGAADDEVEALKSDDFHKAETSEKPIKIMGSTFEASSSLKLHLSKNKTVKNNANEISKDDSFPKEEAASKKPINFMGLTVEEGATSKNFEDKYLPPKKRKWCAWKWTQEQDATFINDDAENVDDEVEAYDFHKGETSKKPIKLMGFTIEASSSLKTHMYKNKTVKNNANEILKDDSFPKEEADSKKPINFMGIAVEEGANSKNFEEKYLPPKKRWCARKWAQEQDATFINEDVENVDVLDQECVKCESSKKKGKNSASSNNNNNNKRQRIKEAIDAAPSELPQEFKDKINEMGGTEITLLITKSLFKSDLNSQENRLLMPLNQIKNLGFLREEELQKLREKKGIPVILIQPSLELTNLTLVKWVMAKKVGATNFNYVLRSSWKKVVDSNQLKEGDIIQVWSFQVQEELHMALVKLNL